MKTKRTMSHKYEIQTKYLNYYLNYQTFNFIIPNN